MATLVQCVCACPGVGCAWVCTVVASVFVGCIIRVLMFFDCTKSDSKPYVDRASKAPWRLIMWDVPHDSTTLGTRALRGAPLARGLYVRSLSASS